MEHFYQTIQGWFTFPQLYTQVVREFDNAVFVEIGTWKGKSAAYMAVEIVNYNKNIKFFCIDPWTGETLDDNPDAYICEEKAKNTLYEHFLENTRSVQNVIIPIKDYSLNAVHNFKDNSIDFAFIDASHDYDSVLADLNAWYPKVKKGGILSGHDYHQESVNRAVQKFNEHLNLNITEQEFCYILRK